MKSSKTIEIDAARLKEIESLLAGGKQVEGYGSASVIETFTAKFSDGYEADIKFVNAEGGPYIDPVLFLDGHEAAVGEPAYSLAGAFEFEHDGHTFTVEVKAMEAPVENPLAGQIVARDTATTGVPFVFRKKTYIIDEIAGAVGFWYKRQGQKRGKRGFLHFYEAVKFDVKYA